jgi:hypothetical protein
MTASMWTVLELAARGDSLWKGCWTRSDHGGRHGTLGALRRRRLIDVDHNVTELGRELLANRAKMRSNDSLHKGDPYV